MIEEIKNRISITSLLNTLGVQVKNGFVLSPSNPSERTPSCYIYEKTNTFKDYSSGLGGDVIDFYMAFYNIEKGIAIKELANLAGLSPGIFFSKPLRASNEAVFKLQKEITDGMTGKEINRFEDYKKIIGEAEALRFVKLERMDENSEVLTDLYNYCKDNWDAAALCYLRDKRKINDCSIERFRLFSIRNYYEVNNHLKKEFDNERLQRCGLFNNNGNLIFALHRIIIPYIYENQIIYLRGRYFDKDGRSNPEKGSKYIGLRNDSLNINSPKRFFNGWILPGMVEDEIIYITEGEFDAIIIEQMGFNAVAIPGATNLPKPNKLEMLRKLKIVFCGDNDKAGRGLFNRLEDALQTKNIYTKQFTQKDINEWYIENEKSRNKSVEKVMADQTSDAKVA